MVNGEGIPLEYFPPKYRLVTIDFPSRRQSGYKLGK